MFEKLSCVNPYVRS